MATKNILPIALIGAGAVYLATRAYNTKAAIDKLHVANPKIKKVTVKVLNVLVQMQLDVVNPSSAAIPFEYYTGTINYQGTKLAEFNFNGNGKNVILAARNNTPLTFEVNITNLNALRILLNVFKALGAGQKVDTVVDINSSLYAAGIDVPVLFRYDLKTQETISGFKIFKALRKTVPILRAGKLAKRIFHHKRKPLPTAPAQVILPAPVYSVPAPAETQTPTSQVLVAN